MTKINVGDKIIITNVRGIYLGSDYWKNGDEAEVIGIDSDGDLKVTVKQCDGHPIDSWFYVTQDEAHCIRLKGGDTQ